MPWQCSVLSEGPIVETCYSGVLTPPELAAAIETTIKTARESRTHLILGDCTDLEGGHSITDLYYFAEAAAANPDVVGAKEALLLPHLSATSEMVEFWETTCLNRGIWARIFDDRRTAIDWLLDSGSD